MFISNPAIVAYTDLKKARKDLSYNVSGIDDKINALKTKLVQIDLHNKHLKV